MIRDDGRMMDEGFQERYKLIRVFTLFDLSTAQVVSFAAWSRCTDI